MYILGIESSCDETAAAVLRCGSSRELLSNRIATQIDRHRIFGGVVPEIASRMHIEAVSAVAEDALREAGITANELGAVAVTYAPGLIGALLVGVNFAKGLAAGLGIPLLPVHHIEGHICANLLSHPDLKPPFVCLVASGGHATVAMVEDFHTYRPLAKTRDDAPGEAFDKVARLLGLGYPGGPVVEAAAKMGNENAFTFTRPKLDNDDFSFSGVKTAVINLLHNAEQKGEEIAKEDLAASFQKTVTETLAEKLVSLAEREGVDTIALAGGVACNGRLRRACGELAEEKGMKLYYPEPIFCTDNAAMIAMRGSFLYEKGIFADSALNAKAVCSIGG